MNLPIKIQLSEVFLQSEKRDGFFVSQQVKEVWAVLIDLLFEFRRVCDKYNITWYADAGTILGAVRHHGFVPWDDDIDVMLLRPEYERLCKIATREFKHPYFFQTEKTDHGCFRGHAQLRNSETTGILVAERGHKYNRFNQGIFLDIFPIDDLPQDKVQLEELTEKATKLKRESFEYYHLAHCVNLENKFNNRFLELFRCFKYLFVNQPRFDKLSRNKYESLEKLFVSHQNSESQCVGKLCLPPFQERRIWKRDWFLSVVYLPFEDFDIPVPSGYLDLLDTFYGNWKEFIIGTSSHGGVFFDTRKSYLYYL